jgi:bifunctional enzyme CysN/CysC
MMTNRNPPLTVVVAGHVDHGKSTLVGRLLLEAGAIPPEKLAALREQSRRRGLDEPEWSFVTDALQSERDQGITIDISQARFSTTSRDYLLIDVPGHKEFLRNMVTGSATAHAALLVVDAAEGVSEQTRRHAYVLRLLGVGQVIVVVNKIDLVGCRRDAFETVRSDIDAYLRSIELPYTEVVPVSARLGHGIAGSSPDLAWYDGPPLFDALDRLAPVVARSDRPLRFPVQDVYKFDARRIVAGRIETGRLRIGDRLLFQPGGRSARILSIEAWNAGGPIVAAATGQSIGVTLDEDIFIERGHLAAHPEAAPSSSRTVRVRLIWLHAEPLETGQQVTLRLGTAEHDVVVRAIDRIIDVDKLSDNAAREVRHNEVAEVVLASRTTIFGDDRGAGGHLGRSVLLRGGDIVAGCLIEELASASGRAAPDYERHITPVELEITPAERAARNRHRGGVVWLTGLSGAGKTTLGRGLERALFAGGWQAMLVAGDNVRHTLNADLGFSDEDRAENVRRIAEISAILADAGLVAIIACISPSRIGRELARRRVGASRFAEIYVQARLETCAARDPKGLYARAARGEIARFTGVSAPYEEPLAPDLIVNTDALLHGAALRHLSEFVVEHFGHAERIEQRLEAAS